MNIQLNNLSGPIYIVFNITNKCNLSCFHCFANSNMYCEDLNDFQIMQIAKEIKELKPYNVCFSGGEPLLRPKLLLDIAKYLSSYGIRLSIVSNGTLLDKKLIADIQNAGISEICISLDSHLPHLHDYIRGKTGCYFKTVESLLLLRDYASIEFDVSFTATSLNISTFGDYIEFLSSLKINRVGIMPLMLTGNSINNRNNISLSREDLHSLWKDTLRLRKTGKTVIFTDPAEQLFFYKLHPNAAFTSMEIQANGDLILSPFFPLKLGNVLTNSLGNYWNAGWLRAWGIPAIRNLLSEVHVRDDILILYENLQLINNSKEPLDIIEFNNNQTIC